MNPEDQDFETLKKLLALKRHETPPPGYFENFSSKVMARIESAEATQNVSLWQRIIGYVEARPGRLSAFALAGAAVVAVMLSLSPVQKSPSAGNVSQASLAGVTAAGSIADATPAAFARPDHLTSPQRLSLQPASAFAEVDVTGVSGMNPEVAPPGLFNLNGNFKSFPAAAGGFSTGSVPQRVSLDLEAK